MMSPSMFKPFLQVVIVSLLFVSSIQAFPGIKEEENQSDYSPTQEQERSAFSERQQESNYMTARSAAPPSMVEQWACAQGGVNNSADAVLDGNKIALVLSHVRTKKNHLPIPTPYELAETEKAYCEYQTALIKKDQQTPSCWNPLFGSKAEEDIKKSFKVLTRFHDDDFHWNQAMKESKQEFRKQIAAAGGNPDIAEEIFEATAGIPDRSLPPDPDTTWKDVASVASEDDDENSFFKTVSGEASLEESRSNTPLSLTTFKAMLNTLSQEEIVGFLKSLPDSEIQNIATKHFEEKEIVAQLDVQSLREQLTYLYCSQSLAAQQNVPLDSPQAQQAIKAAFLEQPAPIEQQGLRNSGVDCYLSSALQCIRHHVANLPPKAQHDLLLSVQTHYLENLSPEQRNAPLAVLGSPLAAFLEKKFDGRNAFAAALLRKEIYEIMKDLSQSGKNSSSAAAEMAASIDPITGSSKQQCDTSEALMALMEYLGTPRILLEEKDTYRTTGQIKPSENQEARQQGGELIIPLGIEKESSLQEVIHSNLVNSIYGIENPDGSKSDILRERVLVNPPDSLTISLSRFRMKPDPKGGWAYNSRGEEIVGVPKLAMDCFGRSIPEKLHTSISHLTDTISLPTHQKKGLDIPSYYTPTSIICHYGGSSANSGHYATYHQENEDWVLINDAQVTLVHLDDAMAPNSSMTHQNFLEENAYIVNYRRVNHS